MMLPNCWPMVTALFLPALLLGAPVGLTQAACNAQASSAAVGRQERERCFLQHGAARLTPDGRPGVIVSEIAPSDDMAPFGNAAPGHDAIFGRTTLGLMENRLARMDSASPASSDSWDLTHVLGEMSMSSASPQSNWEADHVVDANPHGERPAAKPEETAAEAIAAEPMVAAPASEEQPAARTMQQAPKLDAVPNWALLMEIHIPTRLRDLHKSSDGPIARLIRSLRQELQVAAAVPATRVAILDVRGEHMKLDLNQIEVLSSNDSQFAALLEGRMVQEPELSPAMQAFDCQAAVEKWEVGWSEPKKVWCCKNMRVGCPKETIVDIEVLPGATQFEPTPASVLATWARQIADEQSSLRQGPLAEIFASATLVTQGSLVAPKAAGPVVMGKQPIEEKSSAFTLGVLQILWGPILVFVLLVHRLLDK